MNSQIRYAIYKSIPHIVTTLKCFKTLYFSVYVKDIRLLGLIEVINV